MGEDYHVRGSLSKLRCLDIAGGIGGSRHMIGWPGLEVGGKTMRTWVGLGLGVRIDSRIRCQVGRVRVGEREADPLPVDGELDLLPRSSAVGHKHTNDVAAAARARSGARCVWRQVLLLGGGEGDRVRVTGVRVYCSGRRVGGAGGALP